MIETAKRKRKSTLSTFQQKTKALTFVVKSIYVQFVFGAAAIENATASDLAKSLHSPLTSLDQNKRTFSVAWNGTSSSIHV